MTKAPRGGGACRHTTTTTSTATATATTAAAVVSFCSHRCVASSRRASTRVPTVRVTHQMAYWSDAFHDTPEEAIARLIRRDTPRMRARRVRADALMERRIT